MAYHGAAMRAATLVPPALGVGLLVVAGVADRALVGQAESARAAAIAGLGEDARRTAAAVRAALGQLEQEVSAERPPAGLRYERTAIPAPRSVPMPDFVPYGQRSRSELAELLVSEQSTPSGLPEAVVARLVLGPAPPLTGAIPPRPVEERLLDGELPVRAEDLRPLASRLGVAGDPRVARLEERLRRAPDPQALPTAPDFERHRVGSDRLEGWTRAGRWLDHYDLPLAELIERAGATGRAAVAGAETAGSPAAPHTILEPVPGVPGLSLRVAARLPDPLRLTALRVLLWGVLGAGLLGLVGLRRAQAREARALARERAFLAGITHELRTPLASIRVLGETLAAGRGAAREYGALVAQESERLGALVERVLTLTRIEQAPRLEAVDPAALVRSAAELVRPQAERRGGEIECRIADTLPACRWDGDAVRRALLNLLDNSVRHGREHGHVLLSAEGDSSEARLAVSDDGDGIRRVDRRRIFGRFERGPSAAAGTGLGLYLAEEVARAHGGRLELISEEGHGATFTLVLPASPPARAAEDEEPRS